MAADEYRIEQGGNTVVVQAKDKRGRRSALVVIEHCLILSTNLLLRGRFEAAGACRVIEVHLTNAGLADGPSAIARGCCT